MSRLAAWKNEITFNLFNKLGKIETFFALSQTVSLAPLSRFPLLAQSLARFLALLLALSATNLAVRAQATNARGAAARASRAAVCVCECVCELVSAGDEAVKLHSVVGGGIGGGPLAYPTVLSHQAG